MGHGASPHHTLDREAAGPSVHQTVPFLSAPPKLPRLQGGTPVLDSVAVTYSIIAHGPPQGQSF